MSMSGEYRHHVFTARGGKAVAKAQQSFEAILSLGHGQVLDLPMDDRRPHPIKREHRQQEGVGALDIDLEEVDLPGRQEREDIIDRAPP
jgi:hypothetical protein